jgi:hypothetical protein
MVDILVLLAILALIVTVTVGLPQALQWFAARHDNT